MPRARGGGQLVVVLPIGGGQMAHLGGKGYVKTAIAGPWLLVACWPPTLSSTLGQGTVGAKLGGVAGMSHIPNTHFLRQQVEKARWGCQPLPRIKLNLPTRMDQPRVKQSRVNFAPKTIFYAIDWFTVRDIGYPSRSKIGVQNYD